MSKRLPLIPLGPEEFRNPHPYKTWSYRTKKWGLRLGIALGLMVGGASVFQYWEGDDPTALSSEETAELLRLEEDLGARRTLMVGLLSSVVDGLDVIGDFGLETNDDRAAALAKKMLERIAKTAQNKADSIEVVEGDGDSGK